MDPVNIVIYAVVCGTLAAYAPTAGGHAARVVVGVLAASALPYLKSVLAL